MTTYRGAIAISAPKVQAREYQAQVIATVNRHMIVKSCQVYATTDVVEVVVIFDGQNSAEARQIMEDAGRETQRPFDSIRVDHMTSHGWERIHYPATV